METTPARAWLVFQLLLRLAPPAAPLSLPAAPGSTSAPDPAPAQEVVSSLVGTDVRLPCTCPPLGPPSVPHVQWCLESSGPVLEQRGQQRWTTEEFSDRAEIPESGPGSGNCSLLLRDLQVTDEGQYHGFMIQDQSQTESETKTGVFICSVKLLVFDHSSVQYRRPGEDLVLDLHTPHAMSLVFQGSNSSEWRSLWQRGGPGSPRVLKDPLEEQLSLRSVSVSDEGLYKVLDLNGLTVSSTRLSVDPHISTALKFTIDYDLLLRAGAVRYVPRALLMVTSAVALLLFTPR